MNLTRHFTFEELIASDYAARHGIDNTPSPEIEGALLNTAQGLERVRAVLDSQPIHVSSGYRSPKLNSAVGGSKTSQHMRGEAADCICPEFGTPLECCKRIAAQQSEVGFDQLIWEYGQWFHVSFSDNPRGIVLTINYSGTFKGLVEQ